MCKVHIFVWYQFENDPKGPSMPPHFARAWKSTPRGPRDAVGGIAGGTPEVSGNVRRTSQFGGGGSLTIFSVIVWESALLTDMSRSPVPIQNELITRGCFAA